MPTPDKSHVSDTGNVGVVVLDGRWHTSREPRLPTMGPQTGAAGAVGGGGSAAVFDRGALFTVAFRVLYEGGVAIFDATATRASSRMATPRCSRKHRHARYHRSTIRTGRAARRNARLRGAVGRRGASAGRLRRQCGGTGAGTRTGTCAGARTAASVRGVARYLGCGAGAGRRGESGAACRCRRRRVAAEREGHRASASASPADGGAVRITVGLPASGLSFDSAGGAVFDVEPNLATVGRVIVNRADDDAGRWSTFGWWMAARGRDFMASALASPTVTGVEVSAFADEPEFRTPPVSLPLTGTATYRGPMHGFYKAEIGTDEGGYTPGSTLPGEFSGTAQFAIRYDTIGSGRPLLSPTTSSYLWPGGAFSGVLKDGSTGRVEDRERGWERLDRVHVRPQRPQSLVRDRPRHGRIPSRDGNGVRPWRWRVGEPARSRVPSRGRDGKQRGEIAGRVSSVLDAKGHPRSIAGTWGVEGRTRSNSRHAFVGAFVLPLTGCRGC